jgi:hypothetical protein
MKLHHLRTAFLVICWVFVCSQGRTTTFTTESEPINDSINALGNVKIEDSFIRTQDDGTITNNNDIINNNTDPSVPEPTTLSLLVMSLLLVGRRWR